VTAVPIVFALTIHPFLAVHEPVSASIFIVEGWVPDYGLPSALSEFDRGSYNVLCTTGGPLSKGFFLSRYKSYAKSRRRA